LEAGAAAGGDRPGLRSAALRVASADPDRRRDRAADLRVDDADDPVRALRALSERVSGRLGHRALWQPAGEDVRELQALLRRAGVYAGEATGVFDDATVAAVQTFRRSQGLPAGEHDDRLGLVDADLLARLRAIPEKKR
jgi:peptidoglycan hydrolase-like protein with peptidoglycan-binding domain